VTDESAPLSMPYRMFVAPFLCFKSLPADREGSEGYAGTEGTV
jgi:hypothetical protein